MCVTRSFTGASSCPVRFYATLIRRARIPVRQVSHAPFAHRTRLLCLPRREFTDQRCTRWWSVESCLRQQEIAQYSSSDNDRAISILITSWLHTHISSWNNTITKQRKSPCDFCILQTHTISIAKHNLSNSWSVSQRMRRKKKCATIRLVCNYKSV